MIRSYKTDYFTVMINNINTGIKVACKKIYKDGGIRITFNSHQAMWGKINKYCKLFNLEDGYFDMWLEDDNKTIYNHSYTCNFGKSIERGCFYSCTQSGFINYINKRYNREGK